MTEGMPQEDAPKIEDKPKKAKSNKPRGPTADNNPNLAELGKAHRFTRANAGLMAQKAVEARVEKKKKELDAQFVIKTILGLPLKPGKKQTDLDEIQSFEDLKKAGNLSVFADGVLEIAKKLGQEGGSIIAMESLLKMGGLMPTTKSDVSLEGINEIKFVISSPKDDIEKAYPKIKEICDQHGIDAGEPGDFEKLKEY